LLALLTAGRPSTVAGRVRVAQGEWRIPFSVFLFVLFFFVYSFCVYGITKTEIADGGDVDLTI